jgi:hypothetical protein
MQDDEPMSMGRCPDCGNNYRSWKSHRALCGRKAVVCTYPPLISGGKPEQVTLERVGDSFECLRCGKRLKKDQGMKVLFLSHVVPIWFSLPPR